MFENRTLLLYEFNSEYEYTQSREHIEKNHRLYSLLKIYRADARIYDNGIIKLRNVYTALTHRSLLRK